MRPTPKNGALKRFVTFALSLMLVFTSFPVTAPAYGSGVEGETLEVVSVDGDAVADTQEGDGAEDAAVADEQPEEDAGVAEPAEQDLEPEEAPAGEAVTAEEPAAQAAPAKVAARAAKANEASRTIEGEVTEDLTYNKAGNYTLTVNGTLKGQVRISGGAKVTVKGAGTIDGTGKGGSVIEVRGSGSSLTMEGGVTVKGGTGTYANNDHGNAGGGILVRDKAGLDLTGGKIDGNSADTGGGIYIGTYSSFTMSGGTVSNNTANTHEGGGIFFAGSSGSVTGGSIIDNKTTTTIDWGGGGIFVNNSSTLKIASALITDNTAQGLGGGVAGCPHASIGIGSVTNGAAIYGNTASGTAQPTNPRLELLDANSVVKGDNKKAAAGDFLFYGLKAARWSGVSSSNPNSTSGIRVNAGQYASAARTGGFAQDYYCTLASFISPINKNDSETVAWTGYFASLPTVAAGASLDEGRMTAGPVEIKANEPYAALNGSLGLTSTYDHDPTGTTRAVTIKGNSSSTHGGGVGCNGTVIFGDFEQKEIVNSYDLSFMKKIVNSDGDTVDVGTAGSFQFELRDGGKTVATAVSDSDGKVTFVGLPGTKKSGPSSKEYTVVEHLTDDQKAAGYQEMAPKKVTISLDTTVSVSTKLDVTTTVYTTTVKSVQVEGEEEPGVFTNTVKLKKTVGYGTVGFEAKKSLVNALDKDMALVDGAFEFTLTGIDGTVVENADGTTTVRPDGSVTAKNDAAGAIKFENLGITSYLQGLEWNKDGDTHEVTVTLKLKEKVPADADKGDIAYDEAEHTVGFTVDATAKVAVDNAAGTKTVTVTPVIRQGTVTIDGKAIETAPIVNRQSLVGDWTPTATKHFVGSGTPGEYTFTLQELAADPTGAEDLSEVPVKAGRTWIGTPGDYTDGTSTVTFDAVDFRVDGEAEGQRNDRGDHWFLMTEDGGSEPGKDPVAYVLKVTVSEDDADKAKLTAEVTGTWYAGSVDEPVAGEDSAPVFYNTDGESGIAFANYAVYAASGAPADATCLVDPKIIKELDGRTIRPGEFSFKLVTVGGPFDDDLSGTVVSATSNDRYGMVDFDAASPAGFDDDGNPVCLVFNSAGDYWYRVVEDEKMENDPTVDYSDEVILFHVSIPQPEDGEPLTSTFEYHHIVDGKDVVYDESVGNPTWHPTMTNRVRDIDLRVRKTSVLDRDLGLEGATYGLYLVNDEGGHNDVLLGEATSDEDGWLLFENVQLASGSRYYFKEVFAPGGHTVSEFRSPYFSVVADGSAPGGLTLVRAADPAYDAEAEPAAQAEEIADEPVALADRADDGATSQEQPDGSTLLTYAFDGGVYDEATRVGFNKLDTRTREWVVGAQLEIRREDTGEVVASWTSGESTKELVATLDVDVNYVLHEVKAPEGYREAADVVFTIDPYGKVSLVSGSENGNAEISAETITLFDTRLDAEEVVTQERVTERRVTDDNDGNRGTGGTTRGGGNLPTTGDLASNGWMLAGLAALIAMAVTGAVALHKRRS